MSVQSVQIQGNPIPSPKRAKRDSKASMALQSKIEVPSKGIDLSKRKILRQKFQSAGKVLGRIGKTINTIHAQGYQGLIIDASYWPEFQTHFGKSYSTELKNLYDKSKTKLSFLDWMSSPESLEARAAVMDKLREQASLRSSETEIHPITGQEVAKINLDKLRVAYLDKDQRKAFRVTLLPTEDSRTILLNSNKESMLGVFICVMDADGVVYAGKHVSNQFHHSTFTPGTPVIFAGGLITEKDKDGTDIITTITTKSGHYKCSKQNLYEFIDKLVKSEKISLEQLEKILLIILSANRELPGEIFNALEFYRSKGTCKPIEK